MAVHSRGRQGPLVSSFLSIHTNQLLIAANHSLARALPSSSTSAEQLVELGGLSFRPRLERTSDQSAEREAQGESDENRLHIGCYELTMTADPAVTSLSPLSMPDSIVPKVEGEATSSTDSVILDHKVLRFDFVEDQPLDIGISIKHLHGICVPESPSLQRLVSTTWDHRDITPLTMSFSSIQADDILVKPKLQDSIRIALWKALSKRLLSEGLALPDHLPRITFDDAKVEGKGTLGIINVVFNSGKAFDIARRSLKVISVGTSGAQRRNYVCLKECNTLPKDIFSIDCLDLPLDSIDIATLFASLASMSAALGSLMGIGKIVTVSKDFSPESWTGVIRLQVKLNRRWMSVPLKDLATRLPTHFKWHGSLYKLFYAGHHHHAEAVHSPDYPLEGENVSETSATSAAASASQTNGNGHQSTEASKKRKTTEQ